MARTQDTHFNRWCPARPASWLLDNGRLNLVLLGAELLASGLQAQVPLGHDDDGYGKLVDGAGAELSPVRYAKFESIRYFIDIDILQNCRIDIDIFQNHHINIDINIDIFGIA